MSEFNVGVIGVGKMGLLHAGIFNGLEFSNLSAIAEKNKLLISVLKQHLPNVNIYSDYEKMFQKEDLDVAVVTTPVFLHKNMIDNALDYDLNVFVEKPLALNGNECESILHKKQNQKTAVGYCRRFMETYEFIKKIIDESILGDVCTFQSQMFVEQVFQQEKGWLYDPEKSGGGVLVDLGSHGINMAQYFFGDIEKVQAVGKSIFSDKVEDHVYLNYTFQTGLIGTLQVSWSIKNYRLPELKFNIQFEHGSATVTEKYVEIYSEIADNVLKQGWNTFYKQDISEPIPLNIGGPEYTREDLDFLKCIKNDKESICNFREASKTNFVIDSVYKSILTEKSEKIKQRV
ncbi:MAG: Gfo/Idh/MocA family protein [Methanobacterium formicicum]